MSAPSPSCPNDAAARRLARSMAVVSAFCLTGDTMLYIALPLFWQECGLTALWQVGVLLAVNRLVRLPLNPLVRLLYTRIDQRTGMALAVVLAAVNGMALGGGCELALACDLRLASMAASFAVPEVTLGTICGAGGTQRLPRLIGETRAKEMIFTGREITAETAREWGLVNGVFTAGSLLEETLNLAEEISRNSPYAVTRAKRSVNGGREMLLEEALEWERSLFGECGESRDRKEGMMAFLEKRPRIFTGE